jgi:septum site-determining protein MinC
VPILPEVKRQSFTIKGIKEGLLINLGEGEWPILKEALLAHIREQSAFFQGARLALDVGNQILHAVEMSSLRDQLSENQVSLWALMSNSPTTEKTAQVLGLATRLSTLRPERSIRSLETSLVGEGAILVRRTLRSGFKISQDGHVIVIGDVNPGAEIIASGSVMVWGKLRGVVHAGASGDQQAVVCALELSPTQLRIADYIATTPGRKSKPQPEMAYLRDGQVVADTWNIKSK